jgi:hypothetical protein
LLEFSVQIHLLPKELYMGVSLYIHREKQILKNETDEVTYLGK